MNKCKHGRLPTVPASSLGETGLPVTTNMRSILKKESRVGNPSGQFQSIIPRIAIGFEYKGCRKWFRGADGKPGSAQAWHRHVEHLTGEADNAYGPLATPDCQINRYSWVIWHLGPDRHSNAK